MAPNQIKNTKEEKKVTTRFLKDAFNQGVSDPVSFINTLLRESSNLKASDVLLEPERNEVRVRARIDGVLYKLGRISLDHFNGISSRVKVLAKLDPTEKRKVQEGQFSFDHQGKRVNVRVEVAQTIHGELIVIRIHEGATIIMDLNQLGFETESYQTYIKMLRSRKGLLLVCGPTGCGKTTTIYSTINFLNQEKSYNIMTIEDPVEFQMEGINQMQTQEEIGFTFAEGLRTILRTSPDVIFVGEIRDKETAEIAVESGLTGHLVLSTIHADDSVGALYRLLDLGIESYLLSSSLVGILSQRLVRKICPNCIEKRTPTQEELDIFKTTLSEKPIELIEAKGCYSCQELKYQGRTAIFEVLRINSSIKESIRNKNTESQIRKKLEEQNFISLLKAGLEKVKKGETTTEEVLQSNLLFS